MSPLAKPGEKDAMRWFANVCEVNPLEPIVAKYQTVRDPMYIDRHVADCFLGHREWSKWMGMVEFREEAVIAAVRLAFCWRQAAAMAQVPHTQPYVIVDDEWLAGELKAPPPHVVMCIGETVCRGAFGRVLSMDERGASLLPSLGVSMDLAVTVSRTEASQIVGSESACGTYELQLCQG